MPCTKLVGSTEETCKLSDLQLSVRPMALEETKLMIDYFLNSSEEFLLGMGAIKNKLPSKSDWFALLKEDYSKPLASREFYYLIWLLDGEAIGHTNINQIKFGDQAKMHLHIWNEKNRRKNLAPQFLKLSLPIFFEKFGLQKLVCEPYAKNRGPNKILPLVGFKYSHTYETIPGWINFKQEVSHYFISIEDMNYHNLPA